MAHTCHAMRCEAKVPPRLHMCKPHWSRVPRRLQRALWAEYRTGQERDKQPTAAYLRAAAACVEAVATAEGHPAEEIAIEVDAYLSWATRLERVS